MIGIAGRAPIASPLAVDGRGRTAESSPARHLRDLIEMVIFTAPGERVMRPTFGSGVLGLVFAPNGPELATTTQYLVAGAIQAWLGDKLELGEVTVSAVDATLTITVTYTDRTTGATATAVFEPAQ